MAAQTNNKDFSSSLRMDEDSDSMFDGEMRRPKYVYMGLSDSSTYLSDDADDSADDIGDYDERQASWRSKRHSNFERRQQNWVVTKNSRRKEERRVVQTTKRNNRRRRRHYQPHLNDLIHSINSKLFVVANISKHSVNDFIKALEWEYDCKLSTTNRQKIKIHLIDLTSQKMAVQASRRQRTKKRSRERRYHQRSQQRRNAGFSRPVIVFPAAPPCVAENNSEEAVSYRAFVPGSPCLAEYGSEGEEEEPSHHYHRRRLQNEEDANCRNDMSFQRLETTPNASNTSNRRKTTLSASSFYDDDDAGQSSASRQFQSSSPSFSRRHPNNHFQTISPNIQNFHPSQAHQEEKRGSLVTPFDCSHTTTRRMGREMMNNPPPAFLTSPVSASSSLSGNVSTMSTPHLATNKTGKEEMGMTADQVDLPMSTGSHNKENPSLLTTTKSSMKPSVPILGRRRDAESKAVNLSEIDKIKTTAAEKKKTSAFGWLTGSFFG